MADFAQALTWLLTDEGGYVDHPRDPGGATNGGITQATYDTFRVSVGKAPRPVKDILPREQEIIYKVSYWTKCRCEEMPQKWAYAVFDHAVLSGPGTAAKTVQKLLGLDEDGVIGNKTIGAIRQATDAQLAQYLDMRLERLRRLPTWGTFGHGWTNRLAKVRARIL